MLIDTHAHLNFNSFKKDLDSVIKRSLDSNVWMINVGSQFSTSELAVEISNKYEQGVYAAIGLHPINLETDLVKIKTDPEETHSKREIFDFQKYKDLSKKGKVVAVGETGLDYYYKPKTKNRLELFKKQQKDTLNQHLDLAQELNLAVIFHCRMAHNDMIEILKSRTEIKGVIHCFTGNWEQAQKYLEMGLYLGFNGIIFKLDLDEIIKKTPLDRILIETDCPYLIPPLINEKRNEPIFVKYIAERIAEIKGLDLNEIARATTENAKNLFNLQ